MWEEEEEEEDLNHIESCLPVYLLSLEIQA